ncbi:oxidoreductase-like domain-containing protein [Janthinobacterium fluminis]|uniref:Oxidoreductase-like domain-containing protein n=1 Tax=Janthinobacterium fluminis TaxID=2987524 RepID=A0ABT5K442_9BURK|nr:oxidoreductase-like domain-containing protein [Janthinobacterium fluminis]MDC8758861.1 oxidoreductase-like domain-containing protein [Janthinobacterium fluminis]
MSPSPAPPDPPPQAPPPPGPDACCRGGCAYCVLELYQDELEQYRCALAAWRARQTAAPRRRGAGLPPRD